jgi:hypothetical protein
LVLVVLLVVVMVVALVQVVVLLLLVLLLLVQLVLYLHFVSPLFSPHDGDLCPETVTIVLIIRIIKHTNEHTTYMTLTEG